MTVPPGLERFARAELVINLPSPWPGLGLVREGELSDELADERHYWPIRLLKELARRPHDGGGWLGMGHAVNKADLDNADPDNAHLDNAHLDEADPAAPDPAGALFAGTPFSGVVLGPLLSLPPGLGRLDTPTGPVRYYAAFPATPGELALATGPAGPRQLFESFHADGVTDVVDVNRSSVTPIS
jgi:hypothetical protein